MSLYQTGVRQIVDAHLIEKSKEKRDYGDYWSASSAGYCMRRLIFERLGVPHTSEDDPRKQRVFTAGHIFHDWIQKLTREAGTSIAQEMELQDEDLMVRGHFDDLILAEDKLILYDYKTVNSRSFLWAKKNNNAMSYYHKMQLGTYMYILRRVFDDTDRAIKELADLTNASWIGGKPELTEARILKIEKDALMMMEQQLFWTPELEQEVTRYWNKLNEYWEKKFIPPCSCHLHEGGFLAKAQFNPFYYEGSPCSLDYYNKWKAENDHKQTALTN